MQQWPDLVPAQDNGATQRDRRNAGDETDVGHANGESPGVVQPERRVVDGRQRSAQTALDRETAGEGIQAPDLTTLAGQVISRHKLVAALGGEGDERGPAAEAQGGAGAGRQGEITAALNPAQCAVGELAQQATGRIVGDSDRTGEGRREVMAQGPALVPAQVQRDRDRVAGRVHPTADGDPDRGRRRSRRTDRPHHVRQLGVVVRVGREAGDLIKHGPTDGMPVRRTRRVRRKTRDPGQGAADVDGDDGGPVRLFLRRHHESGMVRANRGAALGGCPRFIEVRRVWCARAFLRAPNRRPPGR